METLRTRLFASYCHDDHVLVGPLVSLLRASNVVVFLDRDTIRPGKKWREEISQAINDSTTIAIFWCTHSSKSVEVRSEYKQAMALGKDVLPLLLDNTPLPQKLCDYHYIDFQPAVRRQHDEILASTKDAKPAAAAKRAVSGPRPIPITPTTPSTPSTPSTLSTEYTMALPEVQYSKRQTIAAKAKRAISQTKARKMVLQIESEILRRAAR